MIEISKAIKMIERETDVLGTERIALVQSVGRVLREDIIADTDGADGDALGTDGLGDGGQVLAAALVEGAALIAVVFCLVLALIAS